MYELEEFGKDLKKKRLERGSIRKALEEGRLVPIAMRLPQMVERRRREPERCTATTKIVVIVGLVSLVAMFCYALWRIRDIEEPSESSDYDYRMIGTEELDDTSDNNVDGT